MSMDVSVQPVLSVALRSGSLLEKDCFSLFSRFLSGFRCVSCAPADPDCALGRVQWGAAESGRSFRGAI